MATNYNGYTEKFVLKQPKFQIKIWQEHSKKTILFKRGTEFDLEKAESSSICLSYHLGHLTWIENPKWFLCRSGQLKFCWICLKTVKNLEQHNCDERMDKCDKCFMIFDNSEEQINHFEPPESNNPLLTRCLKCSREFYNSACLALHQCKNKDKILCEICKKWKLINHQCGKFKCITCGKMSDRNHRCFIQKLKLPDEKIIAETAGKDYYVFDIESLFVKEEDGSNLHQVNLLVVKRCFSDEEWVFRDLNTFHDWIKGLQEPSKFFAHNLKGYDGRLIFEYLMENWQPPDDMVWRGSKILKMNYGNVEFRDTLLLLPSTIENLPDMFGLDKSQFKKGFFPYIFNTLENQEYIGEIPAIEYFQPDRMNPKKREEFNEWYVEQTWKVWDLQKELLEYCRSDVSILKQAVETYMKQQIQRVGLNPFDSLTIASYAMKIYLTLDMPKDSICRLSPKEETDIKKSMHGGRTDTKCLLREWGEDELARGCFGKYQDVQSLYPTVQFYDPMPCGIPTYHENVDNIPNDFFGFACVDIKCTKYLHHPILVHTDEISGRLISDLKPKKQIVIASPELHLALQNGYVIEKIYWLYEFQASWDLFKSYFQRFIKFKVEASGMPLWIKTDDEWNEFYLKHKEMGIELDKSNMIKNPGQKAGAKLNCNSLWGKFGEKDAYFQWLTFYSETDGEKILKFENDWIDGNIDVNYYRKSFNNDTLAIVCKNLDRENYDFNFFARERRGKRNIAIASMVTSHARCRLWNELNKLGDRVLYFDTDSIIYEYDPNLYNIPEGRYLGEWEDETGGCPIIKFVSTGPKCYSYCVKMSDGSLKYFTKVKGITLNYENNEKINYDSMKMLVKNELDSIDTKCLSFDYSRRFGKLVTRDIIKSFKKTYNKGYVDPMNFKVKPFGWEDFQ